MKHVEPTDLAPQTRVAQLSRTLRDRSLWPPNFVWRYESCSCCAIGMSRRLWPELPGMSALEEFATMLGLTAEQADDVFCGTATALRIERRDVTPEMVADRLDAL